MKCSDCISAQIMKGKTTVSSDGMTTEVPVTSVFCKEIHMYISVTIEECSSYYKLGDGCIK